MATPTTDPRDLWTPQTLAIFDQMQAAGDRGEWKTFRALQEQLCNLQRAKRDELEGRRNSAPPMGARAQEPSATHRDPGVPVKRVVDSDRLVAAYALRWDTVSQGVNGRWYRSTPSCLDDWLAELPADEPTSVPVLVGHGRRFDSEERSDVLSEPVGEIVALYADDIGLRTIAEYHDTWLGRSTLDAIHDDVLRAYSAHLRVLETAESDELRDGLPVLDIVRAEMVEAGPTDDPVDPGAVIVRAGGRELREAETGIGFATMDEALRFMAEASGITMTPEDAIERRRTIEAAAKQQVRDAEWVARQLAKTRRAIESAYADWRSPWSAPDDFTRMRELEREADELDADLRELLCNNPAAYRQLCAECGVGPKVTPTDRLRALAMPKIRAA